MRPRAAVGGVAQLALLGLGVVWGCERTSERSSASATPRASAPSTASTPTAAPTATASATPIAEPLVDAGNDRVEPIRDPRTPGRSSEHSGSSVAKSRDNLVFIAGQDRHARHTHGGEPAHIGNVTFVLTNDGDRVRRITAQRADFLRDHGCEAPPSTVASHPKLTGLAFEDDEDYRGETSTLDIPAKSSRAVRVNFAPVEAYYTWCDRFAIRVRFSVDGKETLAPVAELVVMRVEPVKY